MKFLLTQTLSLKLSKEFSISTEIFSKELLTQTTVLLDKLNLNEKTSIISKSCKAIIHVVLFYFHSRLSQAHTREKLLVEYMKNSIYFTLTHVRHCWNLIADVLCERRMLFAFHCLYSGKFMKLTF